MMLYWTLRLVTEAILLNEERWQLRAGTAGSDTNPFWGAITHPIKFDQVSGPLTGAGPAGKRV